MAARDNSQENSDNLNNTAVERIDKQLDMLDRRLDNLDSIVTSLVERVMHQPVSIEVTCPKCGQQIQIGVTGNVRAKG